MSSPVTAQEVTCDSGMNCRVRIKTAGSGSGGFPGCNRRLPRNISGGFPGRIRRLPGTSHEASPAISGVNPFYLCTQAIKPFVKLLVAAVYLSYVVDQAFSFGAEGGNQQCHACPDVRA